MQPLSLFSTAESTQGIATEYTEAASATIYFGDRLELLRQIPGGAARLIVTSPPYNIGKEYERRTGLDTYLRGQEETLKEAVRVLARNGSLCWQVGNHIDGGEVYPLDTLIYPICKRLGLMLRNRIVWHFEHGLNASRRFSGRYETILWFTKSDNYVFNLDPVRVPQKYPGKKYFKGPKAGEYSSNPLGKNPGDLWVIPNVKHNHIEKTFHPCQFPVELIERLVLAMTNEGDLVIDPYMGVGSTLCAAALHNRRSAGSDVVWEYLTLAKERVSQALAGTLRTRPMDRPVYEPDARTKVAQRPTIFDSSE
jgi:adenine-specific DNA-methyltransferase